MNPFQDKFESLSKMRPDLRSPGQVRPIEFQMHVAPHATGSVLVKFGNTQVICAATFEKKVPSWMIQQGISGGWVTAEYSMLPYSTHDRKPREISKGKPDGRGIEIQRLIGRAIRAVMDLKKIQGYTLWIDCDVLQADGGTRTTAITGAYIAARLAVNQMLKDKLFAQDPLIDSVAAVSVGIYEDQLVTDLCYLEDRDAAVDCNVVMTGSGRFIEVQCAGEEATFDQTQFEQLVSLARESIQHITALQRQALGV